MQYDFIAIEKKWQDHWASHKTFRTLNPGDAPEGSAPAFDPSKPKFYVLDMFPYPSGVGLHVGHPLGYIATDIVARYKRMRGFNVLHPMGYDAFGLPAEQFAVEHGVHPAVTTAQNIANMTRQLKQLGLSYDWDRSISTTDPDYYRWTQWIFLRLFKSYFDPVRKKARPITELLAALEGEDYFIGLDNELVVAGTNEDLQAIAGTPVGVRKWTELTNDERADFLDSQRLAFLDEVPVNWCPALGTVLANEEVTNDGRSERGNYPVFKRPLKQWMLRITAYGDRLADDLDLVDWPEAIKKLQRDWIGRSTGARVEFGIAFDAKAPEQPGEETITVFTTRPDTLFGATYLVLAPEHPLVEVVTTAEQYHAVNQYRVTTAAKTDVDRQAEALKGEKTGVFTGAYAINPVNNAKVPIWIADYVMMGYGTGAIMAVPAHDERDFAFARQFDIPISVVILEEGIEKSPDFLKDLFLQYFGKRDCNYLFHDPMAESGYTVQTYFPNTEVPPDSVEIVYRKGTDLVFVLKTSAKYQPVTPTGRGSLTRINLSAAYPGRGYLINSSNDEITLNGLASDDAKQRITHWLQSGGLGRPTVQYKLRDWLFSRQRYWGEPFPVLHTQDGRVVAVDEGELPVLLPEMSDFRPSASDDPNAPVQPPLGRAGADWKTVTRGGITFTREFNTMPQWAGSCWYYLRFIDPKNNARFVAKDAEAYWMGRSEKGGAGSGGVDLYVGGVEHAVLHLLYARFWHKVLFDLGEVSTPEPFGRLFNQGYIQAYYYEDERGVRCEATKVVDQDGRPAPDVQDEPGRKFFYEGKPVTQRYGKMGKSLKNAVAPDDICVQYGCDTLRLYEMYLGPLDQSKVWSTRDIVGVHRFLQRLWRAFIDENTGRTRVCDDTAPVDMQRLLHKTIKRVSDAMDHMAFNVAIAALIELNNEVVKRQSSESSGCVHREVAEAMVLLLSPMAPHICEELWQRLGHVESLSRHAWPAHDPAMLIEESVEYPVQVNGKLRGRVTVAATADNAEIERSAMSDEKVIASLGGKPPKKVIVVRGKMVNIVA